MQAPSPSPAASAIECPKCSKHSIVNYREGAYHCLNCGFERILSSADEDGLSEEASNPFTVAFGVFVFAMTLLLFL